ncbi:MAG: tripartite tricarboxylate transporter permease [Candidatus Pacearchaeota archaeon]|nr:tripartite tricarboxylate transporter permease [Candidatus Pacearchaeota archaeon]
MLIEIIIALLLGCLIGTFTGLIPGIHINLIAVILISSLSSFSNIQPIYFAIFITSLAITHTFLDFIPSVFLGAPDEDTFLSILPGHQMLKLGKAHEAITLTLYGSLIGILIILLFTPIFIYAIPLIFNFAKLFLPFILIFISIYLTLREKNPIQPLIIFILSGFLGFATLNLPVKEPLLPLLTGLFGSSAILISLKNKTKIPLQEITKIKKIRIPKKDFLKASVSSIISAPLCSFLPGIGSGHAAVIGSEFIKQSRESFLVLIGAINTIVMGLSFITLYTIGRTRTGAAVAISEILETITFQNLLIILFSIVASGILSFFLAINLSKIFAKNINKLNYSYLSIIILLILFLTTIIFSNLLGILVFITSTSLGIFTILSGARRINLMGCLLIPTILYYLF